MHDIKKLVILISGTGSNMQAITQACQNNNLNAKVCAVISNTSKAKGLLWAQQNNIPTHVIEHTQYTSRESFDLDLLHCVQNYNADFVILAGFMRILTPVFIAPLLGKLINIHPSLLPKFKGLNTHAQALEAKEQMHGATVHFVTPNLDAGPIILQLATPILQTDTVDSLANRILNLEHALYIQAINMLLQKHSRYVA
jgi:phosphoribosylglycinamide formyltransferase 1